MSFFSYRGRSLIFLFFFLSSRRRHTRLTCDWSSDVCSSDLTSPGKHRRRGLANAGRPAVVCRTRKKNEDAPYLFADSADTTRPCAFSFAWPHLPAAESFGHRGLRQRHALDRTNHDLRHERAESLDTTGI